MTDVGIVGAGPAGCAVAILLAKKGFNVTIFEKEKIPRYKACGGGVAIQCENALMELGIDIEEVALQNYRGFIISYGDLEAKVDLNDKIGWGVYREDFDYLLTQNAVYSGANIRNIRVNGIKEMNGEILLSTDCGIKKTDILLAADGIKSTIRDNLNIFYDNNKLGFCLVSEVNEEKNRINSFNDLLQLDFSYLKKGFCWAFPKKEGNTINVGIGGYLNSVRNNDVTLKEMLINFVKSQNIANNIEQFNGALLPFGGTVDCFGKGNVILLGDAAGLASPLTGEGIPYALESGIIGANSVIRYFEDQIPIVDSYTDGITPISTEINKYAMILQNKLFGSDSHRRRIVKMCSQNDYLLETISKIFMHITPYEEGIKRLSTVNLLISTIR
ncbi:MAG: geranylgeranyl reductase family protein [Thermoplasmatales archaeon]|nr:geranylgeranyl reductase family protein [Thermoplasmatales archaeon]